MKKLLFIAVIAWAFLSANLKGQYFQETYGTPALNITLSGGVNTTMISPNGHAAVGARGTRLHVVLTATTGAPVFNSYYQLVQAGVVCNLRRSAQIVELNAGNLAVVGSFQNPVTGVNGLYYLTLNAAGGPVGTATYVWGMAAVTNIDVNGIFNAGGGGNVFVTGGCQYAAGGVIGNYPFAASFTAAGVANWGQIYLTGVAGTVMTGYDIDATGGNCWIVGSALGITTDGFIISVNPANGAYIFGNLYGTNNTNENFTGVCAYNSPNLGGPGIIVCGSSDFATPAPVNYDAWVVKLTFNLGVVNAMVYDYNPIVDAQNYANDIIERITPGGLFTYFLTGYTNPGILGAQDIHTIKIDDLLNNLGDFTYGTALNEFSEMVGIDNGGGGIAPPAGLAVYGTQMNTAIDADLLIVKAYFNGVTQCNQNIAPGNQLPGPGVLAPINLVPANNLMGAGGAFGFVAGANTVVNCYAAAVGGGINLRAENPLDLTLSFVQEPSDKASSDISLFAEEAVSASIDVVDMRGSLLFSGKMNLSQGENKLPEMNLATGVYLIRLSTDKGQTFTHRMFIP